MSAWVKETAQLCTCAVCLCVTQITCSVANSWRVSEEVIGPQSQLVLSVITSQNCVLVPAGRLVLLGDWQQLTGSGTEMGPVRAAHTGCLPSQRGRKLRWTSDLNVDHVYNLFLIIKIKSCVCVCACVRVRARVTNHTETAHGKGMKKWLKFGKVLAALRRREEITNHWSSLRERRKFTLWIKS